MTVGTPRVEGSQLVYPVTIPWPGYPVCRYGAYALYEVPCVFSGIGFGGAWNTAAQRWGPMPSGIRASGGDQQVAEFRVPVTTPETILLLNLSIRIFANGTIYTAKEYIHTSSMAVTVGTKLGGPTASFREIIRDNGMVDFTSTSTDPLSRSLFESWDFGDGTTAIGSVAAHTYTKPGDFQVKLTTTNSDQQTDTTTKTITIKAAKLEASIDLLDDVVSPLDPTEPVKVKVTARALDGVGKLTGVRFDDNVALKVAPADMFSIASGPSPAIPMSGFDLDPRTERSFDLTLKPEKIGKYTLSTSLKAVDAAARNVTAEATSPGVIGEALEVAIVLDPPFADQPEGPDGPEPVDVTATLSFKNTTAVDMTGVLLTSLRVDRTKAGQLLAVTQTGGVDPGSDGVEIGALAPGETKTVTATFRATDDAEVEFSAQALATMADGRQELGIGKKTWSLKPKYLLALNTRTTNPAAGLLPAGEVARISGTIKNLSTSASVEIGPLYPTLTGNGGSMSLSWDDVGSDPRALTPTQGVILEPSESKNFTVRILTSYSEPRGAAGDLTTSGGTKLTATFTPWGKATFEDGTTAMVKPEQLRTTEADLSKRISIDDSITIPPFEYGPFAGAVLVGGVEGLWNAACSMVTGVVDLAKLPYTVLVAAAGIHAQIWKESTPAERLALVADTTSMTVAILLRSAQNAAEAAPDLYKRVNDYTLKTMTDMENNWRIGDYTSTARLWSSYGADAVGQVMVPIALAKIAKAPATVAVLRRAQEALNTRMAPLVSRAATATRIEELVPILESLASGTELLPAQLETLYGITEAEYAALKKIGDDLGILMTVRSRHETSIKWITEFAAKLKPEALKIKTVSAMDVKLGYKSSDIGRLVFRKPEALIAFERGEGSIGETMAKVAADLGYEPGSMEWQNAFDRQMLRVKEWRKWEKEYKRLDAQGWINVSVDYGANAAVDSVANAKSSLGVSKVNLGKYEGFRLRPTGEGEEFIVEMFNGKEGRFVPITGDIDPIAFTHLDGSALTAAEHARVLDAMRLDPLLLAQHGESATYVEGGVEFVVNQFKPGEPGLQIAPGPSLPRVVRINGEKSRWENPFDYHIYFEGGFVYTGSYIPRTAIPQPAYVVPAATLATPGKVRALPAATTPAANVGRCRVTYGTPVKNVNTVLDANGKLARLAGPKNDEVQADPDLHSQCFSPGPDIPLIVPPSTTVLEGTAVDASEVEIPDGEQGWGQQGTDLRIGDQVVIGAGGATAETRTIAAFGSIILDRPLAFAHEPGEAIVVTAMVPRQAPTPTTTAVPDAGATTTTTAEPGADTTTSTVSGSGSPTDASGQRGVLPVTGGDPWPGAGLALTFIGVGCAFVVTAHSRRRRARRQPDGS